MFALLGRRRVRRYAGIFFASGVGATSLSCDDPTAPVAPEVPTGVTVVLLTPTSARVTWNPNADASRVRSYNIIRNGVKLGEVGVPPFIDIGLTELATYKYSVSANGTNGLVSQASADTPSASITPPDATPPTIVSTNPSNAATGVDRATKISVTFSEALDPATAIEPNFRVMSGAVAVIGTVAYSAATRTIEFTPSAALASQANITVSISTQIRDAAGNALASPLLFSFKTRDDIAPAVISTSIPDGVEVPVNQVISATMSESIDPSSLTPSTVHLNLGSSGADIAGAISYDSPTHVITFTPSSVLASATDYVFTVGAGIKDIAGNASTIPFTKTFRTTDVTPPSVTSVSPVDLASGVSVNASVSVTFSKPMDASTITATSMTLRLTSSGGFVSGSISYDPATRTASYIPSVALLAATGYTIAVLNTVRAANGVALPQSFLSTFSTAAALPPPDVTPPSVVSSSPSTGSQNVATTASISITFSEPLDASTVNSSTIILTGPGGASVAGIVSYDNASASAIFSPASALLNATGYTVIATTGVRDIAGNSLASQFSAAFTTIASVPPPDVTPPTVVTSFPANASTGVSVTSAITVGFSEDIIPATVNSTTFELSVGGVPIPGAVSYDATSRTGSFVPTAGLLAEGQTYTATITTGVKDLAGNSLATNFVFSFVTADLTAPVIVSRSPAPGSSGVATNSTVQVGFDEPMTPSTINGSTIGVSLNGSPVAGSVSYDVATRVAKFTPSAALASNRTYTVVVGTGVRDAAGNALAGADSFAFTTVPAPPAFDITGFSVPAEGWWQTTTEAAGISIHIHIVFAQNGSALSLSPLCPLGINDRCITLPRNQAGADLTGPVSPGYVWVLLSNLNGTMSGSEIAFTATNANGFTFTFTGIVNSPYLMTGTITGPTLPTEQLTFTRPVP